MIHPRHALARQSYPHHTGEHLVMLLFDFLTIQSPTNVEPDHTAPMPRLAGAEPNLPIFSNSISIPNYTKLVRTLACLSLANQTQPEAYIF